jgi:hypothetical protein
VITLALADKETPTASQAPNMMVEVEWLRGICPSLGLFADVTEQITASAQRANETAGVVKACTVAQLRVMLHEFSIYLQRLLATEPCEQDTTAEMADYLTAPPVMPLMKRFKNRL